MHGNWDPSLNVKIWIRNFAKFEDKVGNRGNIWILMEFKVCDKC